MKELYTSAAPLLTDALIALFLILEGARKAKKGFYKLTMKYVILILAAAVGIAGSSAVSVMLADRLNVTGPVLALISFLILSAAALLILVILKNIVGEITKLPIIRSIDKLGGFLFGLILGAVIIVIVVKGCGFLGISFFSDHAQGTVLLDWLCNKTLAVPEIRELAIPALTR